jgi:hypothetical protein
MVNPIPEDEKDAAKRERAIRSLTDRASAPVEHVRRLFTGEFARLGRDAKVRKFLHILTTSNVRKMLRLSGDALRVK